VVNLIQNQLLTQACFMRAQRVDATANGGDMMAQVKVQALCNGALRTSGCASGT
jgi:hypothetical protein